MFYVEFKQIIYGGGRPTNLLVSGRRAQPFNHHGSDSLDINRGPEAIRWRSLRQSCLHGITAIAVAVDEGKLGSEEMQHFQIFFAHVSALL